MSLEEDPSIFGRDNPHVTDHQIMDAFQMDALSDIPGEEDYHRASIDEYSAGFVGARALAKYIGGVVSSSLDALVTGGLILSFFALDKPYFRER